MSPQKGKKSRSRRVSIANEILMLLRTGKKFSKDVSIYDPIGTDKDGETVSLIDVIETDETEVLETIILEQDVEELYDAYKRCLKDIEKQVLSMRYGLFGEKEHTQREIACKLDISRSYVSRIEKRAILKLRKEFEKKES